MRDLALRSGEVSAGGMKISQRNIPSQLPRRKRLYCSCACQFFSTWPISVSVNRLEYLSLITLVKSARLLRQPVYRAYKVTFCDASSLKSVCKQSSVKQMSQ